jgi:hypothetical protein
MRGALRIGVLLAAILLLAPGSAAALTFVEAPGSPYQTTEKHFEPSPGGILGGAAAGDFNGDGISDLAVVNATGLPVFSAGESVTVLLGHPNGELTMAPGSPVELYSGGIFLSDGPIATGDFNGDGHLDLAVVDNMHDTISILLGNGTGRFRLSGAPIPFSGGGPTNIAVGDFDGNGTADIAFANGKVNVLLGDGSGGFAPAPGSPFATAGYAVAAGDFNGNRRSDLAVTTTSGQVAIYLAAGEGRFQEAAGSPLPTGEDPASAVAVDLNRDGKTDLAVANQGSDSVSVLLGDGAGGFAPAQGSPFAVPGGPNSSPAMPGEPDSIAAGDFNGDGNMDLAMANFNGSSDDVAVLQGDGRGGFANAPGSPFPAHGNPRPLVVGDFSGDGLLDMAVVNSFQGVVTVLENTSREGSHGPPPPPPGAPGTPPAAPSATRGQILASLARQLGLLVGDPRARMRIGDGSFGLPFTALEAGTATLEWYASAPARWRARDARARLVLLASGELTFSAPATRTMRVRFTKAGRLLWRETGRVRLTVRGIFRPVGSTPITAVRIALRRYPRQE